MKNILALLLLCYGMNMDAQKQYIRDVITAETTGLGNQTLSPFNNNIIVNGSTAIYSGFVTSNTNDGYLEISKSTSKGTYPHISISQKNGIIKSVTVRWYGDVRGNYQLDMYGDNEKPCTVKISNSKPVISGALIGQIKGTAANSSTTFDLDANYKYITFVSTGQYAAAMESIEIDWDYTYTRPTTPDKFGTICLPYNVPSTNYEGAEFYSIAGVNKDASDNITAVVLQEETDLIAGTPYIFKATASTLSATYTNGKSDVQSATGLVGWMPADETSTTAVPTGSYILSNNEIHQITGNATATIGPNRAYLNLAAVPTYVPNPGEAKGRIIRLGLDGSITDLNPAGIDEITNDDNTGISAIYSLDGTKLATMRKGINIVKMKNGTTKKVHIK